MCIGLYSIGLQTNKDGKLLHLYMANLDDTYIIYVRKSKRDMCLQGNYKILSHIFGHK